MRMEFIGARALVSILALTAAANLAFAADLPSDKPTLAEPDVLGAWSGLYVGGHVGAAFGYSGWSETNNFPASGTSQFVTHEGQIGPFTGGYQIGWNQQFGAHWLVGAETDITFPDVMGSSQTSLIGSQTTDQSEFYATLRSRFGYVSGNWLLYATAGAAVARDQLTGVMDQTYHTRWGYSAGLGAEVRLTPLWSVNLQYVYDGFPRSSAYFANASQIYSSNLGVNNISIGLNYHFGADENAHGVLDNMDNWSIHGQTTAIYATSMPFPALYTGANSLGPTFTGRDTWTVTGYIGYRLTPDTEFYINPETFQGYGFNYTRGVAAFPDGEAQKAGYSFPIFYASRLFVRQTFGLGGEQESFDDAANQLAGKKDISRVTVTAGRMSVTDLFDNNSYSHDPRGQFMNYALMDAGAFDYAADTKAYSWGAVVEFNQKNWAVRAGYFLLPNAPLSENFDASPGKGQTLAELEQRYTVFEQAGRLRLTAWWGDGITGSFNEAVSNPAIGVANIAETYQHRPEYGFIANAEQAINADLGIFSRLSWRTGGTLPMDWTDIDKSASLGLLLKGTAWGRPQDYVGVAGIISGLSNSFSNYLAAGGMGITVGDGALSYSGEKIVEMYYSYALNNWSAFTLDYQFVGCPGYNTVRGPANIISGRIHAQF